MLVVTGQHPGLDVDEHGLAGLPRHDLGCRGLDDPMKHAERVAKALVPLLHRVSPDMVIVHGDTSSALGGAMAADRAGIALAHVEAGLRSHDRAMPWPEEGNRVSIDSLADLLFAPTVTAADNLVAEGVVGEVHVTGNTGIDALKATLATLPTGRPKPVRASGDPLDTLVTCHRRENWGGGLTSLAMALVPLAAEGRIAAEIVIHPNPRVADTMGVLFADQPGIRLSLPSTHRSMIARMRRADLILSDSGGVQEEAPALGIPLLILREKTERPEAIASGNALLVGSDSDRIRREIQRLQTEPRSLEAMTRPAYPFGDGRSAPRIATLLRAWLVERDRPTRNWRRA